MVTTAPVAKKNDDTLTIDDYSYHEFNLLKFPIFVLDRHIAGKPGIININIQTKDGGIGKWQVSSNVEYGLGGPFDDAVFMALNKILSNIPKPIQNPIDIGSLRGIARMIGIEKPGKAVFTAIRRSLHRLNSLLIKSELTYFDKLKGRKLNEAEGSFHLVEKVCFTNQITSNNQLSEKNHIWFSDNFLNNINNGYVCPIDLGFYFNLKTDTARALFKLFIESFYAVRGKATAEIKFRYSTICERTTLKKRVHLSLAEQQLNPAHEELLSKGFFKSYCWSNINGEKHDWYLSYVPGANNAQLTSHEQIGHTQPPIT